MKKIIISLSIIVAVAAVVVGATTAFYSDTEVSKGNVLAAGAIDLGVDNVSYYNGQPNPGTSWELDYDLDPVLGDNPATIDVVETDFVLVPGHLFFNFRDLKPGDWGEDTISLHVNNNDSYLCADVTLTSDNDNDITEPEGDDGDLGPAGPSNGDLADAINFYWWADDGDNVYEEGERLLPAGTLGALNVGQTATVALADSQTNIWNVTGPIKGGDTRYIGKAWCFGNSEFTPYPAKDDNEDINTNPTVRPVLCDGKSVNNLSQTDSMTADIAFRAVQSRNNDGFVCQPSSPTAQ